MLIEKATLADIPDLAALLTELFTLEQEFEPNHHAQLTGLRRLLSTQDTGFIMLARDQHHVVGMVNILFTESTALGSRVGLLEDMVVASDYRGQGIGSRLLKQALDEAARSGCKRITLLTDHNNDSAQQFYRQAGFEPSTMIVLRKSLEPCE